MKSRGHELQFRPELKQYMLPTLVYYLKLIEIPNLELENYLRQEIETNPLLEDIQQEPGSETDEDEGENENTIEESKESDENIDLSLLELFAEDTKINFSKEERQFDPLDNVPAQGEKLYDILMRQARATFDDEEMEIAEAIISNIEEDGHLTIPPEEIGGEKFTHQDILCVLKQIQHFEPIGCAWRDAREPLLVQLCHLGYNESSVECILVRDHLKNLKGDHPKEIMKKLNIDGARFDKAKEIIMTLDPKPGWRCSETTSRYVLPDFIVRWQDNKLCAILNEERRPRIRVRRQYLDMVRSKGNAPKEEIEFIKKRIQSAQNLIIAIDQRRKTLTRIINSILDYQHEFFEKGYSYLKPMTMTEFAKQLNVNTSTISRALANKYLESPLGIHKLKFFFTAAVGDTDKRIIFKKISEIVDSEDKTFPLSDTQIAKKLSRQGIIISRRTISKYRDLIGIPAHQFRRQ
ncbi:MAG: RNA polymerase factor sigma-54 [bacterium]